MTIKTIRTVLIRGGIGISYDFQKMTIEENLVPEGLSSWFTPLQVFSHIPPEPENLLTDDSRDQHRSGNF